MKALNVGSMLDVNLLRKLEKDNYGRRRQTLAEYWHENRGLFYKTGYVKGDKQKVTEEAAKRFEELKTINARHLHSRICTHGYLSEIGLPLFNDTAPEYMERPREVRDYNSPLLLWAKRFNAQVALYEGSSPLIYSQSYVGFRLDETAYPKELLYYLWIILQSPILRYYILTTSGRVAVGMHSAAKQSDIMAFPITPWEDLPEFKRSFLLQPFEHLAAHPDECNKWLYELYQLNDSDLRVMQDTLEANDYSCDQSFKSEGMVSGPTFKKFIDLIDDGLCNIYGLYDKPVKPRLAPGPSWPASSWRFFDVYAPAQSSDSAWHDKTLQIMPLCEKLADDIGISRIVHKVAPGILRIGMINQNRYWSYSQSLFCLHEIEKAINEDLPAWGLA